MSSSSMTITWLSLVSPSVGTASSSLPSPAPHPFLVRCQSCFLLIGHRQPKHSCSSCGLIVCRYCVERGAGGTLWCGVCELTKSISLTQTSALFPSKALSNAKIVRSSEGRSGSEGSQQGSPNTSNDKQCAVCSASFGFFSSRRKSQCCYCNRIVCDGCSSRCSSKPPGDPPRSQREGSPSGGLEALLNALKESSDARACILCSGTRNR